MTLVGNGTVPPNGIDEIRVDAVGIIRGYHDLQPSTRCSLHGGFKVLLATVTSVDVPPSPLLELVLPVRYQRARDDQQDTWIPFVVM